MAADRHKFDRLSDYIALFRGAGIFSDCAGDASVPADYLSFDTRDIRKNTLFFCKGAHFKAEYLSDAERLGASAYVSEKEYDSSLPHITVTDIRRAMSLSAFPEGRGFDGLTVVGITGTKGKSTVAYYVKAVLDAYLPAECAILSSVDNYDGVIREESHLTTPEAIELVHHFENAVSSGLSHLVMEVSSQALKYGRVDGMYFPVACFTNIGRDHISPIEHPDFEDYFASKLKIFDSCGFACINTDAEYSGRMLEYAKSRGCSIVTFGSHPDDTVYVSDVRKEGGAICFRVKTDGFDEEFRITMPGLFNVENAAAAIAVCRCLGVPVGFMKKGLEYARVKGRMEVYPSRDGRVVAIVDYAHNKMSFEALLRSVRTEYPGKKIIMVFGSAGGKAFSRRPDLGEAAGKYADYTVLTEEDPGEEPFANTAADIGRYIAANGGSYSVIEDRGEAIRDAINNHGDDKVVLILGKGRETREKRGTVYVETPSDVDYTLECIKEYDSAAVL